MPRITLEVSAFLREEGVARQVAVLCAVSGGADSSALAASLAALGQRMGVAHVHHGLRPEAEAELAFVARRARGLGVPFHVARVDARPSDARSPEERARDLRYRALERLRAAHGYAWIATAHTQDDQAETLLLRAIRGTGLAGLAGIAPIDRERRLLRPLLRTSRAQLRAYLEHEEIDWCEDASNASSAVPRNRLRAEVLPRLEAIHPGATRKLAELAAAARESTRVLEREATAALARIARVQPEGIRIDRSALRGLEPELRRRVILRMLAALPGGRAASRVHLARVERVLDSDTPPLELSLPGGHRLLRAEGSLWLTRAGSAPAAPKAPEGQPGELRTTRSRRIERGGWRSVP
jgi:tRNA(Ile)-lysidine synthase